MSPRRGSLAGRDGVVRRSPGVHVCAPASRIQQPVLTSWHAEHRHDPIPRAISIRSTAGHVPLGRAPSRAQHHGVPGTLKPRLQPWDAKIRMRVCLCIDATQLAEHGVFPLGHRGRLMPMWPEDAHMRVRPQVWCSPFVGRARRIYPKTPGSPHANVARGRPDGGQAWSLALAVCWPSTAYLP